MNPGTTYKQFEDETILERIKLVKKTQSVLINSIGTMKRLNELDENNANLEMTNIYDEIRRIHDDVGKDFVTTHNIDGVKEEDLFIQVDRRLLEQACLTQIENCVRMNKDKKDLTMKFSYRIKQSFLEVRYSNNGKPAESEIATKMFTNKYHRGDGDGNGFGQKLIQTVMSFHKEGNLIGNVKMNRNAHEEFGFTMSFPLPRNQG
jgi:K+-sensing histidine kinase KdpD